MGDRRGRYRLAFDIGGTFTDFALLDMSTGAIEVHKLMTTPDDPARGSLAGIGALLDRVGLTGEALQNVIHGTTLVTNALIERKGAKAALLTTAGFRDTLVTGEEARYDIYDLTLRFPEPLVPRYRRLGVDERVDHRGRALRSVRPEDIAQVVAALREEDARDRAAGSTTDTASLAICFLHAYRNAENEQAAARLVREIWPEVDISLSSDVAPEIREYERTSTTVANAYVRPITDRYLRSLADALWDLGYPERLYLMLSSGGIATVETASEFPVRLIESGPAGGAIGAAFYGKACGETDLISFDMGGTTAKISLIQDNRPTISHELEVARVHRFKKGSGLPIQFPSVEMLEIGAGGGSIARIDELGLLKVGPDSAGADPGPVCYGKGGSEPTVTDAAVVLGYLAPENFLGGEMPLDRDAARRAIEEHLAEPLGLTVEAAAWGIYQVVVESMASAAKIHLVERGRDPRQYALLAFGGAGPIHAAGVARLLKQDRIIYPLGAGVLSAIGLLVAPVSFEFSRSEPKVLDTIDWPSVNRLVAELEEQGRGVVAEAGVPAGEIVIERHVAARFAGQINEISVELPEGALDGDSHGTILAAFHKAYFELYGHVLEGIPVEVVTWRVVASGRLSEVTVEHRAAEENPARPQARGHRGVYWFESGKYYVDTPVYDRYALAPGTRVEGPAVVEERESTVLVPPGAVGTVDGYRNLIVVSSPGKEN
ncbi:hydantoinase/oxoprolinase family protein [Amycolatopsis rhabdoformis]|uniref:Hydantoinase/oxoprolinase family protein n=1 Tax=Amycolatopsis rhabdoformis TaxID=1448059 RepID=A0ABZ1IJY9_9PSEU|nr:hydantoinase/oxoprolinase family protein [Amycolatopsis rhabdoformis]WSE34524.1 hydantoinase/oxoprolinase family protein [Amycolatopsis rhabdoformis]